MRLRGPGLRPPIGRRRAGNRIAMALRPKSSSTTGRPKGVLIVRSRDSPGLGPDERLGIVVVDLDVVPDGLLKLMGRAMGAAVDVLLREGGEPAFDLVEPGRGGGREACCDVPIGSPGGRGSQLLRSGAVQSDFARKPPSLRP